MRKKCVKRYLAIAIIMSAFLISACTTTDQTGKVTAGKSPFIGGEKGIIAEFRDFGILEDADIEEIFLSESFPIEVEVKNKGEFDVEAGGVNVTLSGINLADFGGIPARSILNSGEIERVSDLNLHGGEEILDFTPTEDNARYIPEILGNSVDITVVGNIVFHYKTFATVPKVCFKGDLKDKSFCEVEEVKTVFSSAAPIQVKKVQERSSGIGLISLEFDVENVGQGKVTKHRTPFDIRIPVLEFNITEKEKWDCTGRGKSGEVRLDDNGKGSIVCRLKESAKVAKEDLFTKEVALTLNYDYKDTIHKQLRINKE